MKPPVREILANDPGITTDLLYITLYLTGTGSVVTSIILELPKVTFAPNTAFLFSYSYTFYHNTTRTNESAILIITVVCTGSKHHQYLHTT
jgi:hypothetical protein